MTNKTIKFKADALWALAIETLDTLENPSDARNRDLTQEFRRELENKVRLGESINININGLVRSGKSTVAQELCWYIKKLIKKHHKLDRPMGNKNILRDQNEYSRVVKRRPESFKHECDVIDEWAEMELAGYNSTIEQKYLKQFSDVQAGRYYHRISCSPTNTTDENSDILLQTVPGSRNKGKILLLLNYRISNGENTQTVLLGHIKADVQEVLDSEWYKEYLRKKEEKWELMNKHNVKSPRELEYAEVILSTYKRMKDAAELGLNKKKHFKMILTEEADKKGIWFSILGDRDVLETLEGMGELAQLNREADLKVKKAKQNYEARKIGEEEYETIVRYRNQMRTSLSDIINRLGKQIDLWKQYQLIDEK